MNHPKSSMGSRRVVETSCVVWMDLLGYGSMLREVGFDPTAELAEEAIARLGRFQDAIANHSNKLFPSVVMNDGVVFYRDLSPRAKSVTYEFLLAARELHQELNSIEHSNGHPGVRAVLAAGFRVRRKSSRSDHLINGIGQHILNQAETGEIPLKQAIYSALTIRPTFDLTAELQANFAFSKAYLAESSGTSGGFSGPNLFVDHSIFTKLPPEWAKLGKEIIWQTPGMEGVFSPLEDINCSLANSCQFEGVLDAFEIAKNISNSKAIVERLKELTIKNN